MKNRNPKRKMAMKMMLKEERTDGTSPFDSIQWNLRSKAIKKRLSKS